MPKAAPHHISGPAEFQATFSVSRETVARLETYEALLKRWQNTINLVAPSTLADIWHRHFADSAQLWRLGQLAKSPPSLRAKGPPSARRGEDADENETPPPLWGRLGGGESQLSASGIPPTPRIDSRHDVTGSGAGTSPSPHPSEAWLRQEGGGGLVAGIPRDQAQELAVHWLDIGSGAGFPGLVLAIMGAEADGTHHTLIESDSRKVAFLREVARHTGVAVDIVSGRIETPEIQAKVGFVDCVTARALAPLPKLLGLAAPYFASQTLGLFLKGREVTAELEDAMRVWNFTAELKSSVTDPEGRVVLLTALNAKTEG